MKQDLGYLIDRVMQVSDREELRSVVEKELLHFELLFIPERKGFLDRLTFQGGIALRLCHGAPRLSEDLDFSGGSGFSVEDMEGLATRCAVDAAVTPPKGSRQRLLSEGVTVSTWRVRIRLPSSRAINLLYE